MRSTETTESHGRCHQRSRAIYGGGAVLVVVALVGGCGSGRLPPPPGSPATPPPIVAPVAQPTIPLSSRAPVKGETPGAARAGDQLGKLLQSYRNYLTLLAW